MRSISEINGVGRRKASLLRKAGYYSIEKIANTDIKELIKIKGVGEKTAFSIIKRAQSIHFNKVLRLNDRVNPFPRDQLILIDIETDLGCSYVWAICAQLADGTIKQWFAPRKSQSDNIITEFENWLHELSANYDNLVLGSWSSFDFRVLAKLGSRRLRSFFNTSSVVDFLAEVKKNYAIPTSSFGLKPVSAFLGYKYDEKGMDGMVAASTYMRFESLGGVPVNVKDKLLQYNKDDVLAMWLVLDQTLYAKSEKEK
ncbi:MAG: ribonuclease H-like domain-containing protein [Candidatus Heimdallarchaeota archaeon]|nr:ribonuclease H-like domain-containing protein [Candidatus Heimdallarchaeota archaeon]MCK5049140.1 ribonuclease H-like domain-containing protein [Candidatus Heimdallarchaeota archaeon]